MKPLPFEPQDWKLRWKVTVVAGAWGFVLHRVARIDEILEPEDYDGQPYHIIGATCCGRTGHLVMPGVMSCIGRPRCSVCCRIAGVPQGDGMPANHGIEEAA